MPKQTRKSSLLDRLKNSVYTFPLILVVLLLSLTALEINGSSVGTYNSIAYGADAKDQNLLYGHSKPIRSDEFLSGTPLTILQYKAGFPKFNEHLGSGRDVILIPDAPVKHWVTIFRPQNWAFFVLPIENAFAFRWWLGAVLLVISAYFFVLRVLGGNKRLAVPLSVSFGLSPFLLWWYQSTLFIPMAYSFLILIFGMRVINQERMPWLKSKRLTNLFYVLVLTYLGSSFVLFLYPPFLIPLFIVMAAFLFGYLVNERFTRDSVTRGQALIRLGLLLAPLILIVIVLALFAVENKEIIRTVASSVYPGHRVTSSGISGYSPLLPVFGSFLIPFLQSGVRAAHYYANQSEASNFILLLPFLIFPAILIQIIQYRKSKEVDFTFLFIQVVSIMFLLRISVHFGDPFYNLLLLNRVPHNRLLAGVGLVGFFQLLYMIKLIPQIKIRDRSRNIASVLYGLICFAVLIFIARYVESKYPLFLRDLHYPAIAVAGIFSSIITLLLARKMLLATYMLLGFTLLSIFWIVPIYRGLGFLHNSEVVKKIENVSRPEDDWAVVDSFNFENIPLAAGRGLINGAQIYTDLDFWRQIDKNRQFENVYNRQAHALFVTNTVPPNKYFRESFATIGQDLELVKGNVFKVRFTCSDFVYNNVDFVLTTHELNMACVVPVDKVGYPEVTFYIYKVSPPN